MATTAQWLQQQRLFAMMHGFNSLTSTPFTPQTAQKLALRPRPAATAGATAAGSSGSTMSAARAAAVAARTLSAQQSTARLAVAAAQQQ